MTDKSKLATRQNEPEVMRIMKAARQAYKDSKLIGVAQMAVSVVAALGALGAYVLPAAKPWAGLVGILGVVLDILLQRQATKSHEVGAQLQELFDAAVFELPPGPAAKPDPEDREALASRFDRSRADAKLLRNWYPSEVRAVSIERARLICQRANMLWDAKLRTHVWALYLIALVLLVVAAVVLPLARQMAMQDFVVSFLVPIVPAGVQLGRKLGAHYSAANESTMAKDRANELWIRVVKGDLTAEQMTVESRKIQDALYERRRRAPQVPDLVYMWKRAEYEKLMKVGAAEMVASISRLAVS